ncbi:MAG: glpQ1 [Thermoleophilia bacterium]|nr:glpQ1 [Thermoleophilia bacterium]
MVHGSGGFKFESVDVDGERMLIAAPRLLPAATQSPTKSATQIVAHRGYHDRTAPYENTIDAYQRAIALGADLMETDIRRTADGILVLHHDATINGRRISDTRFADLPLLPNGQRLSTFQDLVALTAGTGATTKLLVETKEYGYEQEIVAMLRTRLQPGQYELMGFDLDSVRALRELAPDARVGLLIGLMPDWENGTWPITGASIVSKARRVGADFVGIDWHIATEDRISVVAAAGLDIAVWTVDKQNDLRRFLADSRIDRIITDTPDVAMRLRDAAKPLAPVSHITGRQAASWWSDAVAA